MVRKYFKPVSLLLTLVLFVSLFSGISFSKTDVEAEELNGHKSVCSNSNYTLYVNEDTLSLIVADKKTGAYMESYTSYDDGLANKTWWGAMNSAVVLTMISGNDDTKQANTYNDNVTKKVTFTETGFTAVIFWTTYQLGVTLEVSLTSEGLICRIPDDSIIEKGDSYQIGSISIYPYMGTSYKDDKAGYMLVPDGNGALIYLDDKEDRYNAGYSGMIYGSDIGFDESSVESLLWDEYKIINDSEQVIAPVYGIAHTDDGIAYLAIVEDGAMRANIECMPNGVSIEYNRCYAKFIERKRYTQPTSNNSTTDSLHLVESDRLHSDLQVRFIFLSGDEASYAGMANAYRDYLIDNGTLTVTDNGYTTRVDFLGSDREEWVIGTSAVVMTTVEDIYDIYEDLESRGVDDILTVYKGWQKGGIYNLPISSYKADSKIGGTKALTQLIKDAEADGISFYLYDDALRINPDEYNVTFNTVKMINKRKYTEETYKDVYEEFNWLIPSRSNTLLNKLVSKMTAKGVDRLAIAGISNTLFSYTYSGNTYSRLDCAEAYLSTLTKASEQADIILEEPAAYLWGTTDAFLDMPLYTSSYILEDCFVPFISIVLKGIMPVYSEYVNFEANKQEFLLKMIETGTYPSFYITEESSSELIYTNSSDVYSSQYSAYAQTIEEYDRELGAVNARTEGAVIVGHEMLDNGITAVTYSNGVMILINYSETSAEAYGTTLESMTYAVIG